MPSLPLKVRQFLAKILLGMDMHDAVSVLQDYAMTTKMVKDTDPREISKELTFPLAHRVGYIIKENKELNKTLDAFLKSK